MFVGVPPVHVPQGRGAQFDEPAQRLRAELEFETGARRPDLDPRHAAALHFAGEAAKQRRRRGVLRRPYYDFVRQTFAEYLDLEHEAGELACFQSDIVHGLLQTVDYARALIHNAGEVIPPEHMDKFVQLRMQRQERLRGDNPLVARVAMVEAALHTQVGGPAVLRDQLRHLIELSETVDSIDLRVLPFAAGGHPAVGSNYTVLTFPGESEPEVVYSENVVNFVLQDEKDEVLRFQQVYDRVWSMALDPAASANLIRRAITKLADEE